MRVVYKGGEVIVVGRICGCVWFGRRGGGWRVEEGVGTCSKNGDEGGGSLGKQREVKVWRVDWDEVYSETQRTAIAEAT